MALTDSTIAVDVHDTLPDILDRLRQQTGRTARLRIPAGSAVLLTANEFRVLKEAADHDRVQLTLESPDRLRLQLARMFGLPAAFPDPAVVTPIRPDVATEPRPTPPAAPATTPAPVKAWRHGAPAAKPSAMPANGRPPIPPTLSSLRWREEHPPSSGVRGSKSPSPELGSDSSRGSRDVPPSGGGRSGGWHERESVGEGASRANENGSSDGEAKPAAKHSPAEIVGGDVPREILLLAASDAIPTPHAKRRRLGREEPATIKSDPRPTPAAKGSMPFDVDALDRDQPAPASAPRHRLAKVAAIIAGVIVAVMLALVAAAALALPQATIAVTLKQQPVQGDLTYRVVNGQPAGSASGNGLVFPATPFAFDVTISKSIPTTGTRLIPEKTASGSVKFANPTRQAVKLPKGTRLVSDTGVPFELTQDVTVPAGDATSGRSGFADGSVRAVNAGATGNLEAGVLNGRLDAGVYYSNREGPTSGGTDKKVPAVAAADLQTLQSQIEPTLAQTARAAATGKLPAGQTLVASSLALGQPSYTFDHKAGDEATALSLTAVVHLTGLSYDQAAALARAKSSLQQQLGGGLPVGYTLDPASLNLGEPAEIGHDRSGARFKLSASGHAHATFSASEQAHLAKKLAGKSPAAAERLLQAEPALAAAKISYAPSWFPQRLPRWAKRIEFRVQP